MEERFYIAWRIILLRLILIDLKLLPIKIVD